MHTNSPVRVVFDLDGTLVDSLASLASAGAQLMREMGRTPLPVDGYDRFVGRGVGAQVIDLLTATGGVPDEGAAEAIARYHEIYAEDPVTGVEEYPGARDALLALADQGCVLGVCTQKPEALARQILVAKGHLPPISAVVGGDTLPGVLKPDPQMLFHAADQLGDGPLIYVGDSGVDAQTAANAEVPFILTAWGYRNETPSELPHSAVIPSFDALRKTVALLTVGLQI